MAADGAITNTHLEPAHTDSLTPAHSHRHTNKPFRCWGMLSPSDHHTTFSTFCHSHNAKCHFKCIFEDNWLSSIVITSYRCTAQDIFSSIFTLVLIEQRLQSIIRFWMDHLSKCFCFFTQVLIKTKSLHILHTFTQTSNAK